MRGLDKAKREFQKRRCRCCQNLYSPKSSSDVHCSWKCYFKFKFDTLVATEKGCLLWSCRHFRKEGVLHNVGKVSWVYFYGELIEGLQTNHYCDNPFCVNPEHLWQGTQQDNIEDMVDKGRAKFDNMKGKSPWNKGLPNTWNLEVLNSKEVRAKQSNTMREKAARGEHRGNNKLDKFDVEFIKLWLDQGYCQKDIAEAFGICAKPIKDVKSGKHWLCRAT